MPILRRSVLALTLTSTSLVLSACGSSSNDTGEAGAGGSSSSSKGSGTSAGGSSASGSSQSTSSSAGGNSSAVGGSSAGPSSGGTKSSNAGGSSNGSSSGPATTAGGATSQTTAGGSAAGGSSSASKASGGTSSSSKTSNGTSAGGSTAAGGASATGGNAAGGTSASSSTATFPATPNAWQPSTACVDEATKRVKAMTLTQKVGQMLTSDSPSTDTSDVATYSLGSIFSGGSSDPSAGNTSADWSALVSSFLSAGQKLGTPILYGIDAVHGNNNVVGAVMFPHNIGLGCTRDTALVEEIGKVTALEMRAVGMNWAFSPVAAPGLDERWGRTYETFAETPDLAAEMAVALNRGLQGSSLSAKTSVLGCAKHFAGDGATEGGKNEGNCTLSEAEFKRVALDPYQSVINAGVGSIMMSLSSYNGTKMTGSKAMMTDTIKGTMGFRGFIVSDWAAIQKIPPAATGTMTDPNPPPTATALATAINAGLDMIMEPYVVGKVHDMLVAAPTLSGSDQIPESRIDDAVTRILSVKCEMGMFASDYSASIDSSLTSSIGSDDHKAVARRAVRESMVLLQNTGNVLPLPQSAKVLLAGTAADSRAKQCGGWTIDWQGLGTQAASGEAGSDTPATTIRQGIEAVVGAGNVTYAATGTTSATGITHAIVVVGEKSYAETKGDATDLTLSAVSKDDVTAITNLANLGVPTVVVVISGRPIIITDLLSKAGAWIAAWLPGSEGEGVADVLFGDYKPSGKLSHSWPKSMSQIPINVGDADYESDPPLFAYGFGLTY
jgi:beta-glucosidase